MTTDELKNILLENKQALQRCLTFRERLAAIMDAVNGHDTPEGFVETLKESAALGEIRMPHGVVITKELEKLLQFAFVVAEGGE